MSPDITNACEVLRKGGVILYMTDTVWGLGCDATNSQAVQRVITIKNKSNINGLIVLLKNFKILENYTDFNLGNINFNSELKPTSWIIPKGKMVDRKVIGNDGSIAFRVPKQGIIVGLLKLLDFPLVSTSANIHGTPTPTSFSDIDKAIIDQVDYVLTSTNNDLLINSASRILKVKSSGEIQVIRE